MGDKVREIFGGQATFVALYDRASNMIHIPYWVDGEGQPVQTVPRELGESLTSIVIRSRQPLVLGTVEQMQERGGVFIGDGPHEESWMGVPILVGQEVTGAIALQDWPQNRYDEGDVRLLSTLAASMGVALENARLFEETTRLLEETQQRTAELQIINSVQQGLAAQLDIQAIYDLVGDQIRDLFDAQSVMIQTYDQPARLQHIRYGIEKGQRFYQEPVPFSGMTEHLIRTREVVLINEDFARRAAEFGMTLVPGTEMDRSSLGCRSSPATRYGAPSPCTTSTASTLSASRTCGC